MVFKKAKKKDEKDNDESGLSLDDAFGDDEGVEYAESKPKKAKKKGMDEDELEDELDGIEKSNGFKEQGEVSIKASRPISKLKKGERIRIDGKEYTIDSHYVLMDHKTTKEMAIELYDDKEKDYQLRYFDDQVESTLEFYELQEIMYVRKGMKNISW